MDWDSGSFPKHLAIKIEYLGHFWIELPIEFDLNRVGNKRMKRHGRTP